MSAPLLPTHHTTAVPTASFFPQAPFEFLNKCKDFIFSYPLLQRVTTNWKILLMDVSTVLAVSGFVITFFTGSSFLWMTFAIFTLSSAVSAFYIRSLDLLAAMEASNAALRGEVQQFTQENTRLTESNTELKGHNAELKGHNTELKGHNETAQANNAELSSINAQLNAEIDRMTREVTALSLQVTQLQTSAEKICKEVSTLGTTNHEFGSHVEKLESQLRDSKALCATISTHLATQQGELATQRQGLGEQIEILKTCLVTLAKHEGVSDKIQSLNLLETRTEVMVEKLHRLEVEYAALLGLFKGTQGALELTQGRLEHSVTMAAQNNVKFSAEVSALHTETQRLETALNRVASPVLRRVSPPPITHASHMMRPIRAGA